jgi:hypothetical protein
VHRTIADLTPVEFRAGRLLLGMSVAQLAAASELGQDTIRRLESGTKIRRSTREQIARHPPRDAVAPTQRVLGPFHGARLRRACWHLRLGIYQLASCTGIPIPTLKALMAGKNLQAKPTPALYRMVGELEDRGYVFANRACGGDRPLTPRQPLKNPNHRFRRRPAPLPLTGLGRVLNARMRKEMIALADQEGRSVDEMIDELFVPPPDPEPYWSSLFKIKVGRPPE